MPAAIQPHLVLGTLMPMESAEAGQRLERFIRSRWDRDRGGLRGLSNEAGISTDSLYKWFRGESEPTLAGLQAVSKVLGVRPYELVAVYHGDRPAGDIRDLMDPEVRQQLVELIADQVQRTLRQGRD